MTARTAIGLLGGAKTLGVSSGQAVQWERMVCEGVPVRSADALREAIDVPDAVLAQLLGVSETILWRVRAGNGRLSPAASLRLLRAARIVALAFEVLESEQDALRWLMRPQPGLGVRPPLALLATDAGRDLVEKMLLQIGQSVGA